MAAGQGFSIVVCRSVCYYRSRRWRPGEKMAVNADEKYPRTHFATETEVVKQEVNRIASSVKNALFTPSKELTPAERADLLQQEKESLLKVCDQLKIPGVQARFSTSTIKEKVKSYILEQLKEKHGIPVNADSTLEEILPILEAEEKSLSKKG